MSKSLTILGIDPGYGRCGWGLIEIDRNSLHSLGYGVIETTARESFPRRLFLLHEQIRKIIRQYAPDEAAVEELFFSRNVKTAVDVGQARGVVILTCAQAEIEIAEYKPVEIKMAVTGYGAAPKTQIQSMVKMLLGLKTVPRPDDAADALAVAICHAHSRASRKLALQ